MASAMAVSALRVNRHGFVAVARPVAGSFCASPAMRQNRFVGGLKWTRKSHASVEVCKTPRAAAIAGIIFSLLLITSEVLVWLSIPSDPSASPLEVVRHAKTVSISLNLVPFAGIAFLWFMAVVRDHLENWRTASLPPSSWVAGGCTWP